MPNIDKIPVNSIKKGESNKEIETHVKISLPGPAPPEITSELKIFSLKGKTAGGISFILGSKLQIIKSEDKKPKRDCEWSHSHNILQVANEEDAMKVAFEGDYIRMIDTDSGNSNS